MHLNTKHFLTIGFNFQVPQTTSAMELNPREGPLLSFKWLHVRKTKEKRRYYKG